MSKTVLVAVDGSPQAAAALEHALAQFPDADIVALTAIDPVAAGYASAPGPDGGSYPGEWVEQANERADWILDEAVETAADEGREIETVRVNDRPARAIVEYAGEEAVDHIVIGSHGRTGVTRVLLGSVAEKVVRRSPCPVTVVR
ncbi:MULTISPECIES: universal stress protein [Halolamina]|uniref:Nucleotide-binding universal stress protein, UspA family n=1 Tax=Halolamina pelagica TaxID=699431 RepID=A0A1I5RMX6_9EURY|nr:MULTISPECIES: universal stress protein [Halolamina]NHX35265.1 universal stress protein [Halolamina sp. R1-12]SFP59902.1 Nucleotide-binding universal stress protein, UspA family [Halolamina pelagica]